MYRCMKCHYVQGKSLASLMSKCPGCGGLLMRVVPHPQHKLSQSRQAPSQVKGGQLERSTKWEDLLSRGMEVGSYLWAAGESIHALHKLAVQKSLSNREIGRLIISWMAAAISSDSSLNSGQTHPLPSARGNPLSSFSLKQQLPFTLQAPDTGKIKEDSSRKNLKESPLFRALSTSENNTELRREDSSLEDSLLQEPSSNPIFTQDKGKSGSGAEPTGESMIEPRLGQSEPESLQGSFEQEERVDPMVNTWLQILKPGSIALIIGGRGVGKTSTAHKMLEYLKWRGSSFVVGLPRKAQKELPDWIGIISEIREAPLGATVLLDEGSLLFSSKESMSERNRNLLSDIVLARQRDHTLIIITQDSSYIDRNILRSIDTLIIKEPAPLQTKMDRPEIRSYLRGAAQAFEEMKGDRRPYSYVAFSPSGFTGVISISQASYWSERLSKAYAAGLEFGAKRDALALSNEEKMKLVWKRHKEGRSIRKIALELGVSKSTIWNWVQRQKREEAEAFQRLHQFLSGLGTTKKSDEKPQK